jgi:pantothenate kinase-related protein Tda10
LLVAPQLHVVKNYLAEVGAIEERVRVPLILGIWGPKGCGKTFQTELALKKLGCVLRRDVPLLAIARISGIGCAI